MKETEYYRNKTDLRIKVGIITILGLIILFVGYGWLRDWYRQGRYANLQVKFTNAGNIDRGDSVTLFGVKSGRVSGITMTDSGVILDLLVDLDFPLPEDTKFYISDSDLMGNRKVDIIPGSSSRMLEPGSIPKGENLAGLSSLIPRIDGIIGNLDLMITNIASQDDLFENLQETITSSRKLISMFENFFSANYDELEGIIVSLHQTTAEINTLFSEDPDNLKNTVQNLNQSIHKFDNILEKMNMILDEAEPLMTRLNEEEGTLHHLITEKELYDRLVRTTAQIDSLLIDVRENPRRYFQFRLF